MKQFFLVGFLTLLLLEVDAQISISRQVVGISGGSTSSDFYVSSTSGQIITGTISNSDLTITQGFEQPESNLISSIEEHPFYDAKFNLRLFPNPTVQEFYLDVSSDKTLTMQISLFSPSGKRVLHESKGSNSVVRIDVSHLPPATYVLRISDSKGLPFIQKSIVKL